MWCVANKYDFVKDEESKLYLLFVCVRMDTGQELVVLLIEEEKTRKNLTEWWDTPLALLSVNILYCCVLLISESYIH